MSFMESYKRLEKLCGEVLRDDGRISAYIKEMERTPRGSTLVPLWDDDLKQLKHYRWVRNQIGHEPNCTEANMCRPGDEQWLDRFYSRIMNQTDPLALYRQKTMPRPAQKPTPISKPHSASDTRTNIHPAAERESPPPGKPGCLTSLVLALTGAAILVFLYLVLRDLLEGLF